MAMERNIHELHRIYKALHTSGELLEETDISHEAKQKLNEAEKSFHQAFQHVLNSRR